MKRKLLIFVSFLLVISLLMPIMAKAVDTFHVYPYLCLPREIIITSDDFTLQDTDENISLLPTNLNEQTLHIKSNYTGENNDVIFGVNFPLNFITDQSDLTYYADATMYMINFEFEVYPLSYKSGEEAVVATGINKIIRDEGADTEQIYYPVGKGIEYPARYEPNGDMSLFYKTTYIENSNYVDYAYGCYTFHITMAINFSSVTRIRSLFFDIDLSELFANIDEAIINIHPATTSELTYSNIDDIYGSISELNLAVQHIYDLLSEIENNGSTFILSDIFNKVDNMSDDIYEYQTAITNEVQQIKENLSNDVQSGVEDALDKTKEELESEALEDMNNAVEDIQQDLNIDISAIQSGFENLYDSITTHETDAKLTLPAGKVTIGDTEYVFWEETEIDFSPYFEYPIIQTLLIPMRFVIIIGFGYFMLSQVKKIESIVTMNSNGEE